jgi:hypothetical protein
MRKHDVNEIHLKIYNVIFWSPNELCKGGMRIFWTSDLGFGTLDIIKTAGNSDDDNDDSPYEELVLEADTEYMDTQDDKAFTKKLMELLVERLTIT